MFVFSFTGNFLIIYIKIKFVDLIAAEGGFRSIVESSRNGFLLKLRFDKF